MAFAHLHVHTEYSLLNSACRIDDLLDSVVSLGQSSVAITDGSVMYGAAEFYGKAAKRGLNPIIGCEVNLAAGGRFNGPAAYKPSHLVLLCENNTGYGNLIEIVSQSFTGNEKSDLPTVGLDLLRTRGSGLIALSGGCEGEIPRRILRGDFDGAEKFALKLRDIFGGGNFYLELQNHGLSDELKITAGLRRISRETGIPLVCTNDVRYIKKEQAATFRVLRCIATGETVNDPEPAGFDGDEYYLKSESEMLSLFGTAPVENAAEIAARCRVTLEFHKLRLPVFDARCRDHFALLRETAERGAARIFGENPGPEVAKRLDYELGMIKNMGYVDYFLIVWDFVNFARKNGIPVGPGRGSGAGSLVAYCIGITGIDPLKYDLLFERFLNPERVSMPDFDIDFCFLRRQEVIDYAVRKYGADHVAQIVTFGTMAAHAAVRDGGRALGLPYALCDKVARMIPAQQNANITLDDAMADSAELRAAYENSGDVKRLIDTARQIEGMPRHSSVHPAGIVITDLPVSSYVPLSSDGGARITQYQAGTLEELGLLKIDFLGLRTVTIIDGTVKRIRENGVDISEDSLPQNDPETFKMLGLGYTDGVFQLESRGMRDLLRKFSPDCIEDLIALISLFRPGPMDSIPKFIHNHRHPEDISYETELLRPILSVTYGCIVYQEQVMRIFRDLAGYSLGRADIVRRAMAKKQKDKLEKERHAFVYGDAECAGCAANGIRPEIAERLFDEMSAFGLYAYNKSHAAAYAAVAYRTAYLKRHYPAEFMASQLTFTNDRFRKLGRYIDECSRLGVKILPVQVNKSAVAFEASGDSIRFGFAAVKSLGEGAAEAIVSERERGGEYKSLYEFCERHVNSQLSRHAVENLILCGAFDGLGYNRREMLSALDEIMNAAAVSAGLKNDAQISLFGCDTRQVPVPDIPRLPEMPLPELLKAEKEVTGTYFSGHPMAEYAAYAGQCGAARIADITGDDGGEQIIGKPVKVVAAVTGIKQRRTKSERIMADIEVEDMTGSVICTVFPDKLEKYGSMLKAGAVLEIDGKIAVYEGKEPGIIMDGARVVPRQEPGTHIKAGLYLKMLDFNGELFENVKAVLRKAPGETPVIIVEAAGGRRFAAPRSLYINREKADLPALRSLLGEENVKMV